MSHTYTVIDGGVKVPFIPHPSWAYWFDELDARESDIFYREVEFYHVKLVFSQNAENEIWKNLVRLIEISKAGAWYDSSKW